MIKLDLWKVRDFLYQDPAPLSLRSRTSMHFWLLHVMVPTTFYLSKYISLNISKKIKTYNYWPWETISGAHSSTLPFAHVLKTQWYLNLFGLVHVWESARRSHLFRCLAFDSSISFFGHAGTMSIVDKDTEQFSLEVMAEC